MLDPSRLQAAMRLERKYSLKRHNTFGVDAVASGFVQVRTHEDLRAALELGKASYPGMLILGGGSNILFVQDFAGLVIQMDLRGIRILQEGEESVEVEVAAGESWQDIVAFCVQRNWGGIENLALIPGTVGGAPVQNVGAYGAEFRDVLVRIHGICVETGQSAILGREDCSLGYRTSIFKESLRGKFVMTSVVLELRKHPQPNTSYDTLARELAQIKREGITIQDVAEAVSRLRRRRLPDPSQIGSAGSFFKNPEVPAAVFHGLKERFFSMPGYPARPGGFRVPAGWLIEQCGWKGKRVGEAGVYEQHALVLVNHGRATGKDILSLAQDIQESVRERFGIRLEPEVQIV
jgi:UDP-N-acetylmuramate dehydrogenase